MLNMLMDEHDKHEEISEITCLRKGEKPVDQSDMEAMRGLENLKKELEEDNEHIKQIERKIQDEDELIQIDLSKYVDTEKIIDE